MQTKYGPYSPSRLEVANCPHRFKLQYIDKSTKDEGSSAARRGNVVHETFEEITKAWLREKGLNWDEVLGILTEKMAHYKVSDGDDQNVCIGAARAYMQNPPPGLSSILGTEEQIAVKWVEDKWVTCDWDDPDAFARGKIDLLMIDDEDVATILDHKTQLFVQNADTFQLGFYGWLVKIAYPYVRQIKTILHFCHPDLNFYSKAWEWSQEDMDTVESRIKVGIGIAERFEDYPAIPNHYCVYCPIKIDCPKLKAIDLKRRMFKKASAGPLISAQKAQDQAEVLTVLEENAKEMKSSLKSFVMDVGPVALPGLEYAMTTSHSYEVPLKSRKDLIAKLGEFGQDPYYYLSFSATQLKKLWKVLTKEQLEEIKDLILPKATTRFGGRKV